LRNLYFDWGVDDFTGWGVYGLQILYWGSMSRSFRPVPLRAPFQFLYPQDPFTYAAVTEAFASPHRSEPPGPRDILMRSQGNGASPPAEGIQAPQVAMIFFEFNPPSPQDIENLRRFPLVVAGSTWGREVLASAGLANLTLVRQGVDTERFRPLPKRRFKDRFVVYSGGKLEFRKAQDIVVRAFAVFAQRHPDALLMTSWRSPWEKDLSDSINMSGLCRPFVTGEDVEKSIPAWLIENGIRPEQFLCLNPVGNRIMPEILREADVAVFPNRCEGGTNLIGKEALSAGLPCIFSANTGHFDIISEGNCIPLRRQRPLSVPGPFVDWGESDVEELIEALEAVYNGSARPDPMAARASVLDRTWQAYYERLEAVVGTL
jgi:glycosyltransferase involved in cell wall biosynthesis